ncbi:unnamed protein product [Dibothriocephalus latus]|uniref:dual-specificity kinase n=1 Tax=Dibothriocephalus latus TaxID=60516 RepID=A0A3P6SVG3_DIBLA|nr:unnamed protein product [Dibothriocephalus latus]
MSSSNPTLIFPQLPPLLTASKSKSVHNTGSFTVYSSNELKGVSDMGSLAINGVGTPCSNTTFNTKAFSGINHLYEERLLKQTSAGSINSTGYSGTQQEIHLPNVPLGNQKSAAVCAKGCSKPSGPSPPENGGVGKADESSCTAKARTRTTAEGGGGLHYSQNCQQSPAYGSPASGTVLSQSAWNGGAAVNLPTVGITPEVAIKQFKTKLSAYELTEILNYPNIYFVGHNAKKRQGIPGAANNCGYDDEQGSYLHTAHDQVSYRYEVLKSLGKGSFGQVVKAFDHKTNTFVGLKMVRNERRFTKQAAEEIRILELLRAQDVDNTRNVVHLLEHFVFRDHVCMTFELLNMNLYELIKRNKFQGFPLQLVRKFAHSILVCLDMLHRNKIIHCDLKPENILLKQQGRSGIKVIDFGSSCFENQRIYTYIQSRFYRAPEVILGCKYGVSIDIWSFGCILAELLTGSPLFPGEDELDQLACIMEVQGMPPQKLLDQSRRLKHFFSTTHGCPRYCMEVDENGRVILRPGKTKRGKIRNIPGSRSLVEAFRHEWLRRRQPKSTITGAVAALTTQTTPYSCGEQKQIYSLPAANSTSVSISHASSQRVPNNTESLQFETSKPHQTSPLHSQRVDRQHKPQAHGQPRHLINSQCLSTTTCEMNTVSNGFNTEHRCQQPTGTPTNNLTTVNTTTQAVVRHDNFDTSLGAGDKMRYELSSKPQNI